MTAAITATATVPAVTVLPPATEVAAVALVLPGGKARSRDPMSPRQLTGLRMRPFASALRDHGAPHGVAVWSVRYRVRGWNGSAADPVSDAGWALDEVRRRHGDLPVVVVGHSMGGRAAIHVAGDVAVRGVVALAPWIEPGDPVNQLRGRSLLVAHGSKDVITSAASSRRFAELAAGVTEPVAGVRVRGDLHAMLLRWRTWHRLATGWTLATLGLAPMPADLARAVDLGRAGDFAVPL